MTGSRSQDVGYAVGASKPRRATCERSRSLPSNLRYLRLDVHAETIAVAVAEPSGEVRSLGVIPNRPETVAQLIRKLGSREHLRACYEAGPCGYVLYWQLTKLGVACDVVAPTLVPTKPGDRVKTDRRDAENLARCHRAGDLTPVWVPDVAHEALRDLVRAREAAKQDQLRARHRLGKFDRLEQALDTAITAAPGALRSIIAALRCLRGIRQLTAATLVSEVGPLSRFTHPRQLMGYSGTVPATRICAGSWSKPPGPTAARPNAPRRCARASAGNRTRSRPSPGRRSTASVRGIAVSSGAGNQRPM